eukprot:Em0009g228a
MGSLTLLKRRLLDGMLRPSSSTSRISSQSLVLLSSEEVLKLQESRSLLPPEKHPLICLYFSQWRTAPNVAPASAKVEGFSGETTEMSKATGVPRFQFCNRISAGRDCECVVSERVQTVGRAEGTLRALGGI